MRRGAIVGFSFGAWTAGIVATSSEQNLLENGNFVTWRCDARAAQELTFAGTSYMGPCLRWAIDLRRARGARLVFKVQVGRTFRDPL